MEGHQIAVFTCEFNSSFVGIHWTGFISEEVIVSCDDNPGLHNTHIQVARCTKKSEICVGDFKLQGEKTTEIIPSKWGWSFRHCPGASENIKFQWFLLNHSGAETAKDIKTDQNLWILKGCVEVCMKETSLF